MLNIIQKIMSGIWAFRHGPKGVKGKRELSYWKLRQSEEGTLSATHYEHFYTAQFGLSREFYKGKKILDIGCGPRGSLEWADMTAERVGLDPLADSYFKLGADKHKMKYVASPSEQIPFASNYFDVVCSFNSLDHVNNLDQTISEIIRVIAPNGYFLLLTELNHNPTIAEPIVFSWDIIEKFSPQLKAIEQKHYEKVHHGIYESISANVPYNHEDNRHRYGVLLAKFLKEA